jgi:hypothetical protein
MKKVTVGTTVTALAVAGNRDFISIFNNDTNYIFLQFDGGETASSPETLTTANGFPLAPGAWVTLNNDQMRNVNNKTVNAISVAGGADVRLQGVS